MLHKYLEPIRITFGDIQNPNWDLFFSASQYHTEIIQEVHRNLGIDHAEVWGRREFHDGVLRK